MFVVEAIVPGIAIMRPPDITAIKSFITLGPGADVIKIFTAERYNFSN